MNLIIYFKKYSQFFVALIVFIFVGCGKSSNETSDGGVAGQQANRLNWSSIPSEFHPEIFEENFQTMNMNRIYVDMFGFKNDVEVTYSSTLAQGQGYLRIYSVFKDSGSRGSFSASTSGQNLLLNRYGTYQCSIKIQNGNITAVKGLCFVRLQVVLPVGTEIEVYNIKQLISRRFIPVEAEDFLKNFKDASFADGKKAVIADYIASYSGMSRVPQLTADQLGVVVDGFSFKEDMFDVLRKLHVYVLDRQNLAAMIEKEFSYFDRDEAKRICKL